MEHGSDVTIVDIRMPFISMVVFMVKAAVAAIPAAIILAVLFAIFGSIFGGMFGRMTGMGGTAGLATPVPPGQARRFSASTSRAISEGAVNTCGVTRTQ